MLNENNITACFRLNADSGKYIPLKIERIIKLSSNNNHIKIHSGSNKVAIDLGYTIYGDIRDSIFKIDNQTLSIKTLSSIESLSKYRIQKNECAIITDDILFSSIVWLSKENIEKKFYYSIYTCNSTLRAADIDYMAKKINKLDIDFLNSFIENTNLAIDLLKAKLEIFDADLYQAENRVAEINESLLLDKERDLVTVDRNYFSLGGNIVGVLKDENDFVYVKVKKYNIADNSNYKNMKAEEYEDKIIINGIYTENKKENIESLKCISIENILPIDNIKNIESIIFTPIENNLEIIALAIKNNDEKTIKIIYRNITDETKSIENISFNFEIVSLL